MDQFFACLRTFSSKVKRARTGERLRSFVCAPNSRTTICSLENFSRDTDVIHPAALGQTLHHIVWNDLNYRHIRSSARRGTERNEEVIDGAKMIARYESYVLLLLEEGVDVLRLGTGGGVFELLVGRTVGRFALLPGVDDGLAEVGQGDHGG